jgi:hypothetical protein
MTYTIKEISLAWTKFTQPKWIVDKDCEITKSDIEEFRCLHWINTDNEVRTLPIDYSMWIPYLISEEWKND